MVYNSDAVLNLYQNTLYVGVTSIMESTASGVIWRARKDRHFEDWSGRDISKKLWAFATRTYLL